MGGRASESTRETEGGKVPCSRRPGPVRSAYRPVHRPREGRSPCAVSPRARGWGLGGRRRRIRPGPAGPGLNIVRCARPARTAAEYESLAPAPRRVTTGRPGAGLCVWGCRQWIRCISSGSAARTGSSSSLTTSSPTGQRPRPQLASRQRSNSGRRTTFLPKMVGEQINEIQK